YYQLTGRLAHIDAQMRIVQLDIGEWLSGMFRWDPRFRQRDAALRDQVDKVEACARQLVRKPGEYDPIKITAEHAEAIISWARGIARLPPGEPVEVEEPPLPPDPNADLPLFGGIK